MGYFSVAFASAFLYGRGDPSEVRSMRQRCAPSLALDPYGDQWS